MTWKLYAAMSAGGLAATYLVSVPPTAAPERATPVRAAHTSQRKASDNAADIEELAARLQARVRAETSYREPGRDPFRFVARRPAFVPPKPSVTALPPPPVVAPAAPLVTLSGIATDQSDGVVQRSAVLSAPAGVLIVREGELVGGLYRVIAIGEESVELEAVADSSRHTLRLAGR
jgi:Tfp pilus assembly protein PilP